MRVRAGTNRTFQLSGAQVDEWVLIGRTLDGLRKLGIEARIARKQAISDVDGRRTDCAVTLLRGQERISYRAELIRTLRPTALDAAILRLSAFKSPTLLLTKYVSPQMAQTLREHRIAFADMAGNVYVEFKDNLIYIVGNALKRRSRADKVARAFQSTGMRVVFALLCAPEWAKRPTRDLATRLGVTNGSVARVLDDLTYLGFITTAGRRDRQLQNLPGLLERWTTMYPTQLRPALVRLRLAAETQTWWRRERFDGTQIALGGLAAAEELTDLPKAAVATLYIRESNALNDLMARRRIRADPEGTIEVLEAFWPVDFAADKPGLAPTVLIYADLIASDDAHCLEAAERIYGEYLVPRWPVQGSS